MNHIKELNNAIPTKPMIFMKPSTALLTENKPFYYPEFSKNIHYEVEVVLKVNGNGRHIAPEFAHKYYKEVALGIDFTARDVQAQCKEKGHPWEIAKAFDHSAVVSPFIDLEEIEDLNNMQFSLRKNGTTVQLGNTKNMIFNFHDIIVYASKFFKFHQGDFLFTGTPEGVGAVQIGDVLEGYIVTKAGEQQMFRCEIK